MKTTLKPSLTLGELAANGQASKRQPLRISQAIEVDLFWSKFSSEETAYRAGSAAYVSAAIAALDAATRDRNARRAAELADLARMDEVHESRASRRVSKATA